MHSTCDYCKKRFKGKDEIFIGSLILGNLTLGHKECIPKKTALMRLANLEGDENIGIDSALKLLITFAIVFGGIAIMSLPMLAASLVREAGFGEIISIIILLATSIKYLLSIRNRMGTLSKIKSEYISRHKI